MANALIRPRQTPAQDGGSRMPLGHCQSASALLSRPLGMQVACAHAVLASRSSPMDCSRSRLSTHDQRGDVQMTVAGAFELDVTSCLCLFEKNNLPFRPILAQARPWPGYRRRNVAPSALVPTFHMLSATLIV